MKIRQPKSIVDSCAPARLLMRSAAHTPKAVEPPARFISCTIVPSITMKTSMPTFHLSASTVIMPFGNSWLSISTGSKSVMSKAPDSMPMNSELYTSLVIRANEIAMRGGVRAHTVSFTCMPLKTTA